MELAAEYNELALRFTALEKELLNIKSLNRSLNMVVENSPAAIVITDKTGKIEYVNPTFCSNTGYSEEEVIGKNMSILKTGYHPPEYYSAMWKTIFSGKTWKDSFYNKKKNGEGYWEQQYIGPIKDEKGEITHFVAVKIDITLQKEFEQKLKANQEYLNAITRALPELVFVIDEDGKYLDVLAPADDPIYQEVLRTRNIHVNEFMSKEMSGKFGELLKTTLETRVPQVIEFEMQVLYSPRWFEGRSSPLDVNFGGKKSLVFVAYDITERKNAQQALKKSEARFRSIFESANTGIVFADKTGKVIFANPTFNKILGYAPNQAFNKNVKDFTPPEDYDKEFLLVSEILNGTREALRIEKRYIRYDGKIIWADLSMAPIRDEKNEIIYLVGMVNDITERVMAEERLKELVATKDKIFSIIAHDLKNPFNALLGISELLYSNPEEYDIEQVKALGKLMNESSRTAYDLLENLLQWSRSQTGQLEFKIQRLNLRDLIESSIKILEIQAYNKKIDLKNKVKKGDFIYADNNLLKTVVRNIVSNAVKYTKSGGWVHIDVTSNNEYVMITVEDSGVGMTQETIKHLFQIENKNSTQGTANEKGTGLGLILCKEFVELHKGFLEVDSVLQKGTKFTIALPKIIF